MTPIKTLKTLIVLTIKPIHPYKTYKKPKSRPPDPVKSETIGNFIFSMFLNYIKQFLKA